MSSSFDKKIDHLKLPLIDVQTATNQFAHENLVGLDGFGTAYKGKLVLKPGQLINIVARRLDRTFGQGEKEFQTEKMMLSSLKHPNIVSIVGFCDEGGEKIIINKFEANGSLDQHLCDPATLPWTQRLQICLDIARALSYIHYDKLRSFSVIHRDVKSSKILLGDKWEAKLSGFELATMQPAARRHRLVLDQPCGSPRYTDPAYVSSATLTHKSDVYSFGVVLVEVMTGRKAFSPDNNGVLLAKLAKSHYENGNLNDFILPDLRKQMDQGSLKKFSEAAYCCLNELRAQRPNIDQVTFALEQALKLQLAHEDSLALKELLTFVVDGTSTNYWKETHKDDLQISFEDIKRATQDFNHENEIGVGGSGTVYRGFLSTRPIAVKWYGRLFGEGKRELLTELEILVEYKHENIIGLVGYCYEKKGKILVYEYASNGSLDRHLNNTKLAWMERLEIGIGIATGLEFLHGGVSPVIHRDIKSSNILLNDDWKPQITGFGMSIITPINNEIDFVVDGAFGTSGYVDPLYVKSGVLMRESDIYSLGVVLFEIMCGRFVHSEDREGEWQMDLISLVKRRNAEGKLDELVFKGIKDKIVPKSLTTFQTIAYQCLSLNREDRPSASEVVLQLKKALEFQEEIEIWEAKLPGSLQKRFNIIREAFSKGILQRTPTQKRTL